MSDDRIPPVQPVELDAVERVPAPAAPRASDPPRPVTPPSEQTLAASVERAELEHPIATPRGVDARATVHDAAQHGNPIARAIERTERAEQHAGAAASAGSGQAGRPAHDDAAADEDPSELTDPLAPVTRVDDDPNRHDPRSREERARDADLRP
jgi:hypothetical protein